MSQSPMTNYQLPFYDFAANAEEYLARTGAGGGLNAAQADERVRAYDEGIAKRLQADHEQIVAETVARGVSLTNKQSLSMRYDLPQVVKFFNRVFKIARYYPTVNFEPKIELCQTLTEFVTVRLKRYPLSETLRQNRIAEIIAEEEQETKTHRRGISGIYLPGQGSYLNGEFIKAIFFPTLAAPADLLQNQEAQANLVRVAVHETLGHGFLAEFSALGQEKNQLGIQDFEYAQHFMRRTVDSPEQDLNVRKAWLVWYGSKIAEEGWAMWVTSALAPALLGKPREPAYKLMDVWRVIESFTKAPRYRDYLRRLLSDVFLTPPKDLRQLLFAVRALQDNSFLWPHGLRQPLAYVLGALLADRLQAKVGWRLMPYALLVATNLNYSINTTTFNDLAALLSEPRYNPDWRLTALSGLDYGAEPPLELATLTRLANEQLNLAVPEALLGRG